MQGLPCIRGTRITVSAILGELAAGPDHRRRPRRLPRTGP
ncbi:MAG: DUF433 domain-containing protein [Nitriliruptorales bacterium]